MASIKKILKDIRKEIKEEEKESEINRDVLFAILGILLSFFGLIATVVVPVIMRKKVFNEISRCVGNTPVDMVPYYVFNESTERFGRYYLVLRELRVSLERPNYPLYYFRGNLFSGITGALTLKIREDFLFYEKFELGLERLDLNDPSQKWIIENGTISDIKRRFKVMVHRNLKLSIIPYGVINYGACGWIFQELN